MNEKWVTIVAILCYILVTIAMFGDVLFTSSDVVLSHRSTDVASGAVYSRAFGFGELKKGNIALWNPYVACGLPYVGNFGSALFYPPNLVYLAFPVAKAININMALHILLLGIFTYAWVRGRGLHPLASFFSGEVVMFSFATFLRITAGHIPPLGTLPWIPLLFFAVDRVFEHPSLPSSLLGILSATMPILAGHPQYFFMASLAVTLYCALRLMHAKKRLHIIAALGTIAVVPLFLSAIQLWPGLAIGEESIRAGGTSYLFATTESFPPENLLTLLAPGFFGDYCNSPYWGRWWPWEVGIFVGITGLLLAIYGALCGERGMRRFSVTLAVLFLLIALGRYTPVYKAVFYCVPGFDRFRCPGRYLFLSMMFSALLSGIGAHLLIRKRTGAGILALVAQVLAAILTVSAGWISYQAALAPDANLWRRFVQSMVVADETKVAFTEPLTAHAATFAIQALVIATLTCLLVAVCFSLSQRRKWGAYAVVLLGSIELFAQARYCRPTFDLSEVRKPDFVSLYESVGKDNRVFDVCMPNLATGVGSLGMGPDVYNAWAEDPIMLRRYRELVLFMTKDNLLREADQIPYPTLFAMLRCKLAITAKNGARETLEIDNPLPRFVLLTHYQLGTGRDAIFAGMGTPSFDPRSTVFLETEPNPKPEAGGEEGTVTLLDESTDHMTLDIDLPEAAILLTTDAYSKGWQASGTGNPTQKRYEVLPADYALRAIPLAAGRHHLRVEYAPLAFVLGKWASIATASILVLVSGTLCWKWLRTHTRIPPC